MKKYTLLLLFIYVSLNNVAQKQQPSYKDQWQFAAKDSSFYVTAEQQKELYATETEIEWFKDAKLGIFVHWGPALLKTNVLSWGRNGERPGAGKPAKNGIKPVIYDNLYKKFDPKNFNADKWMQQIKNWGAEYIVFTAKHHDGFVFFDAKNTEYSIMNTPYGKDICKQLADAAHKAGVKLFWYYSQPDWFHPDNLREKHYENYLPYMKQHIQQLFTKYGKINGVFWDHLATKYWQWDSYHILKDLKKWQPGIISNARVGFGWPLEDRGDYDTPEQSLGPVNHHRYWEACLTMTDKWLYSPKGPIKPYETVLSMLIQVAGNGGNLLLNLGPNGKGEFVEKEVVEVEKLGNWIKKYGNTIKNTRRGIYIGGDYGASTQIGNKLYIHVLQKRANNTEVAIVLPQLPTKIIAAKGITEGFKNHEIKNGKLILHFDKNLDNIVELTLAENPNQFERIETWKAKPISKEEFIVSESSFLDKNKKGTVIYNTKGNVFSEGIHLKKWWEPRKDDKNPSLSLDFTSAKKVNTVLLSENMRSHCVRDFTIETKDKNGNWNTIYNGKTIGEGLRIKLNGNAIYGIRLNVFKNTKAIQITAFNSYE
ncbi:alpha-L-fucosidase [Polaribacter batillariae]|uniref:alpha-L-fucosidase n=1 Tax=Polaribacter batillariae TaxID=2808900 RepID=A0ABX7SYE4_9FLAO|nr:alpha-L-fucosidase [Polaribacter batillariae]QTD38513.1 alpha-L-fucosidase [Polaribacter batillariae]